TTDRRWAGLAKSAIAMPSVPKRQPWPQGCFAELATTWSSDGWRRTLRTARTPNARPTPTTRPSGTGMARRLARSGAIGFTCATGSCPPNPVSWAPSTVAPWGKPVIGSKPAATTSRHSGGSSNLSNGQTVDEALRTISSTAATDRQQHTEEYAEPWAGEGIETTGLLDDPRENEALGNIAPGQSTGPGPDDEGLVNIRPGEATPLELDDEGLSNLEIGETTGLGPTDASLGNARGEHGSTDRCPRARAAAEAPGALPATPPAGRPRSRAAGSPP